MNKPDFKGNSNGEMLKPFTSHALSYSNAHSLLSGVRDKMPTTSS